MLQLLATSISAVRWGSAIVGCSAASATAASSLLRCILICELFVRSDLVASVPWLILAVSVVGALFTNHRHLHAIHWATSTPLVVNTLVAHALPSLVQIVNEIMFISLTANDAFLRPSHPRA